MDQSIAPISGDDLIVWPDGTQCCRDELDQYQDMSDDYEVVPFGTPRWIELASD